MGFSQRLDALRELPGGQLLLAHRKRAQGLAHAVLALFYQLLVFRQLGVAGKLHVGLAQQTHGAVVVPSAHLLVNLFHPARFAVDASQLLTPLAQAVDLEAQSGILVVNGPQYFPLSQGVRELAALLVQARLGDNGIHQIAFFARQTQGAFKVRLLGMKVEGFFEDVNPLVEVRLSLDAAVNLCNARGKLLPLLLLDVKLYGLKEGMAWVL